MGNWFGRSQVVCPLHHDGSESKSRLLTRSRGKTRIKVRMTASRLKELMAELELSKGNSDELGRRILQESLEGKFGAHVVAGEGKVSSCGRSLSSIKEE